MDRRHALAILATFTALPGVAQARPIRLIVPYPPGGPLDIVARALADKVRDSLGPVIVENRPGAGGNLGADLVAKAAPDGMTLVMGAVATHAINPWLFAKIPYDPIRDFTPISGVAQVPNVLVMNPDAATRYGIQRVADLVAFAKQNPGKLNNRFRRQRECRSPGRRNCSRRRPACSWSTFRTQVAIRRKWR